MFRKWRAKTTMRNAFRIADIKFTNEKLTTPVYPAILDVRFSETKTEYVIKLHHGINPIEIEKKKHVFNSIFGENLEFTHKSGTTIMTVYDKILNTTYEYSFDDWSHILSKHSLPILAGKDRHGKLFAYDMKHNPHLLIAGETGSGKSVMLRAIITSLIQHKRTGLRLHLADLKRSEFHLFRNIDIVDSVVVKVRDVCNCVAWFHAQLEKRGDLLDLNELEHIDEYNKLEGVKKEDYLLLCIDEFSMLRDEKDTMKQIQDLTALGRALGIFVILSTQRPDSKVIDGLLKANLTVRYAFRHVDKINSRITLGEGAKIHASEISEKDRGQFIMRYGGYHVVQSPLLSTGEAKTILKTYKTNNDKKRSNGLSDDIIDVEFEDVDEPVFVPLLEEVNNDTEQ